MAKQNGKNCLFIIWMQLKKNSNKAVWDWGVDKVDGSSCYAIYHCDKTYDKLIFGKGTKLVVKPGKFPSYQWSFVISDKDYTL